MALGNVRFHLVETMEDANACIDWLSSQTGTHIGCDTEGTGLDTIHDRVRLVQFGDTKDGFAIPIDRWWGLIAEIVDRWAHRGGRFVFHHAKYDIAMLRHHDINIPVHLVDDTMMLAHIADPSVSIGLKQQGAKHVDPRAATMQQQLDEVMHSGGYTWATIPIAATGPCAVYWVYAALDPIITMRLWEHYQSTLRQAPKAYDLELSVSWVAERMQQRGVCVDRPYAEEQRSKLLDVFEDCTKRGHEEFGVDLSSKKQIIGRLERDKANLWKRTPSGNDWALDKEALKGVDHPLVSLLQMRTRVEKLGSTYLRNFLSMSEYDGRIHASINTLGFKEADAGAMGVKTARMSMSEPNLQNLPRADRSDPLSIIVRNCIVSSPGHTFLFFDLDQIELRIMAHLSRDPGLIEALLSDDDFFMLLMRKVYQDESLLKSDPRRSPIKSYMYATNYGAGLDRLATTTGRPLAEIEELDKGINASYPGIKQFHSGVHDAAMKRYREEGTAYVVSPMTGRRFASKNLNKLYQLVNHLIQGWAAEIFKTMALELDAAGLGDYLALFIHDEIGIDVPDEMVPEAIEIMGSVMNNDKILSLPITAGGARAKRWGEKFEL